MLSEAVSMKPFLNFNNIQLSQLKIDQNQLKIQPKISAINCTKSELSHPVQSIALSEEVNQFLHAALSNNTRRSYQSDLTHFIAWGGVIPASDNMISEYLAAHAHILATATLNRR